MTLCPRLQLMAALDQCGIRYSADADHAALLALLLRAFALTASLASKGFAHAPPAHATMAPKPPPAVLK